MIFLQAVGGAFLYPAEQSSISLMVPENRLARITGLNQSLKGAINIVAPPFGVLLLDALYVQGALSIDFITTLIAIVILFFIKILQPDIIEDQGGITFSSPIKDIKAGFLYFLCWKGLAALIVLAMVIIIALSPAFSLFLLLVSKHFLGDAAQYGLIESVSGIGVVVGGLLLSLLGGLGKKSGLSGLGLFLLGLVSYESAY